jgi:hypothetical protein
MNSRERNCDGSLRGLEDFRDNLLEVFQKDMPDWEREEVSRELSATLFEIARIKQKAAISQDHTVLPWK